MNLSLNFWVELIALALLFGGLLYLMPRIRSYTIRKEQAVNLRNRISDRIKDCLPDIASSARQGLLVSATESSELSALNFSSQRLKALMTESSVLYSDERDRVQRFIDALENIKYDFSIGQANKVDVEDLILLGQRILLDLKENGLLSSVS